MTRYVVGNEFLNNIEMIKEYVTNQHALMDDFVEKYPDIVNVVHYEDLVDNPRQTLKQACGLCGIPDLSGTLPPIGNDVGCGEHYRPFFFPNRST